MGLDIQALNNEGEVVASVCIGYSAFGRWRGDIAESVGINLDEMEGYGGNVGWGGKPYALILDHPDCEGVYEYVELCRLLDDLVSLRGSNIKDDMINICKEALAVNGSLEYC